MRISSLFLIILTFSIHLYAQTKGVNVYGTATVLNKTKDRCALIIGNSNYSGEGKLRNPNNDCDSMANALSQLGFDVIKKKDLDRKGMRRAIDDFGETMKNYEVALVYYSGHGAEVNGINYLFPIDASPDGESDVQEDCISINRLLVKMDDAQMSTNIIILDACRNNPWQKSWQKDAGSGGLANMTAPVAKQGRLYR